MADPNEDLKALKDVVSVLTNKLSELFEAAGPAARMKDDFDKLTITMRSIVGYVGDWKETLTEVMSISKKMASGGLSNAKTYGEAAKHLEEMVSMHKELAKRTGLTNQQQKILQKLIEGSSKSLDELNRRAKKAGASMESALPQDAVIAVSREIRTYIGLIDKLSNSAKKVDMGPITSASKHMTELIGKQSKIQKWLDHSERLKGVGASAKERVNNNQLMHASRMSNKQYSTVEPTWGIRHNVSASNIPTSRKEYRALDAVGKERAKLAGRVAQGYLEDDVDDLAGVKGKSSKNFVDRFMARKILSNRNLAAQGEKVLPRGILGEMGQNIIAKGNGSFTSGLAAIGEGGIGGLAEGAGGLVGAAALPLAAGALALGVFDHTTKVNKDVYGKLGGAGIFSGRQSGQAAFQNVRDNLTPGGMGRYFDALGSTYESNLKVAGAMANSGVDMSELSIEGNDLSKNSVGKIGNTVRTGARLAGMDETQGTDQVMKLLQQYHQSLDSTDQFFTKINKDTKAAGLTTTKYIQIIDGITGSFDNMAKSIDDVTGLLRVMGTTGTMSAQALEDSIKTLAGPEKSVEQKAFIGTQMMGDPSFMKHLSGGYKSEVDSQAKVAKEALMGAGFTEAEVDKMDLTSSKGVQDAYEALAVRSGKNPDGRSAVKLQAAGDSLNDLQKRVTRYDAAKKFQNNHTGQGAVDFAASSDLTPDTLFGKSMMNIGGLQTALKYSGGDFGTLMSDPSSALNKNPLLLSKLSETLGLDKQGIGKLVQGVTSSAASYTGLAVKGDANISGEEYQRLAGLMGEGGLNKADAKKKITGLDEEGSKQLVKALIKTPENLMEALDGSSEFRKALEANALAVNKEVETRKAKEVATSMRPTADIFADAFTNLFNSVSKPLQKIADFLEAKMGDKIDDGGIQDLKNRVLGLTNNGAPIARDLDKLSSGSDAIDDISKSLDDASKNTNLTAEQQKHIEELKKMVNESSQVLKKTISKSADDMQRLNNNDVNTKQDKTSIDADFSRTAGLGAQADSVNGLMGLVHIKNGKYELTDNARKLLGAAGVNPVAGTAGDAVKSAVDPNAKSAPNVIHDNRKSVSVGSTSTVDPKNPDNIQESGENAPTQATSKDMWFNKGDN